MNEKFDLLTGNFMDDEDDESMDDWNQSNVKEKW